MRASRFLPCLLGSLVIATVARAESPPVDEARELGKFLGQHGYGVVHVDNGGENSQTIELAINGQRVHMTIDTGCGWTCLTSAGARGLGLEVHDTKKQDYGVGGTIDGTLGAALVKSFTLTGYEINRTNIVHVLPPDATWTESEGLFGYDFLRLNAVILPVGARVILFKPGPVPVPSFDAFMTAMGYRPVPLTYGQGGLHVQGELNGHALTAIVDCGASYSLFDSDFVTKVAGAGLMGTGRIYSRGVDGHNIMTYFFVPRQLSFGSINFEREQIGCGQADTLGRDKVQALLGYDLLAEHKAIIDLGHDVLWMQ